MTEEQMTMLEDAVNEKIRERISVKPVLYHDKDDPGLAEVRKIWFDSYKIYFYFKTCMT
jgi:hypothetical protein